MISKEERAELRRLLADDNDPVVERVIAAVNAAPKLLHALDASDERIASLEDTLRDLGERDDQLTLELASAFHNLATNVVEAVVHAVLQGRVLDGAKSRIAELEAAAQWRPMDTAPRDGTWVFALLTYHDLPARFWEPPSIAVRWDSADGEWRDDRGVRKGDIAAWLPIPALPIGDGQ